MYVRCHFPFPLLMVYYCHILPHLDLNDNMSGLFGMALWVLIPISWNVSSGSVQLYASLAFFLTFLTIMLVHSALQLHTLQVRRSNFHSLFYSFFSGSGFCSLINNISLRVPFCSIRNFTQFSIARKNCPSARCTTATNLICSNIDMFRRPIRSLKKILPSSTFHFCHVLFI